MHGHRNMCCLSAIRQFLVFPQESKGIYSGCVYLPVSSPDGVGVATMLDWSVAGTAGSKKDTPQGWD